MCGEAKQRDLEVFHFKHFRRTVVFLGRTAFSPLQYNTIVQTRGRVL